MSTQVTDELNGQDVAGIDCREAEDFLFREADLLDSWKLEDWLELFADDAVYEVPATDLDHGSAETDLFIIADRYPVLAGRVRRLTRPDAYAEQPRSRTRRFITNVQTFPLENGNTLISANFIVYRFKFQITDQYVGKYEHVVERNSSGEIRFKARRAILDQEALRPAGRISIIL